MLTTVCKRGGKSLTNNKPTIQSRIKPCHLLSNMLILHALQDYHLTCCDSGLSANMFDSIVSGKKYSSACMGTKSMYLSHFVGMLQFLSYIIFSLGKFGDIASAFGCESALCCELLGPGTGGIWSQ